jgi:CRISPR-associated protein Cst2
MRNALRELLIKAKLPCNRKRLHDQDQLAVEFKEFPNATKFADDFLLGFMVADNDAIKKNKGMPSKRDSVLRMNMAVALTPYRYDATFHQSPLNAGASTWKNSSTSALMHREVAHTAYQYPFALAGSDCDAQPEWTKALINAIAQLSDVAGGHARSYYEMAPKSVVARLTPNLIAGYDTYGFNEEGGFKELSRINDGDLPGAEFWIGGELARTLPAQEKDRLTKAGVQFYDNPQTMLAKLADEFLQSGGK